nr:hypothetical protein [uncultured Fluviicola sp.]
MKILIILACFVSITGFSQTFSDLFTVDTLINLGSHELDPTSDIVVKVKNNQAGVLFKKESDESHASFMFYDFSTRRLWKEELSYSENFQFLVPTESILDFDFDSANLVVRFADMTNYLCVYNRKTGVLESILPSFEDFKQISLIGDFIYFGKHYNSHPKKSPYKTIIGKINWKTKALEVFELPDFDLIEFSHFEPNDWFDVNSKGQVVFSQTVKYSYQAFDENLNNLGVKHVLSPTWQTVNTEQIRKDLQALGGQPNARVVIETLAPWHDKINRVQTIDFLNDSTLIISKIIENQSGTNQLRKFDIVKFNSSSADSVSTLLKSDVPDLLFSENEKLTKKHYEYRIRQKPNDFSNNKLVFIESVYGKIELGLKKKVLEEKNNEAALKDEKKNIYLVVSTFNTSVLSK